VVDGILNGTEAAAMTLFAKSVPYCDVPLKERGHDPKKAVEILDAAGWKAGVDGIRTKDGARLVLDFYFNSNNAQEKTIAEAMQGDLLKIGVELRVIGEEKQAFLDRQRTGEFDLQYSLSWGAPYDPQSYLSSWRIPAHGDYQSQIGLADKAHIDATITALMTEADEKKRAAMVRDVLTRITDAAVYIPVSYSRTKAVYSNRIKDVSFAVTQYEIPFEKMSFTEAGK
jgi:nickel transport system substrate-binding protein